MTQVELAQAPPAARVGVLTVVTLLSVLLSPLTAVWALLVGPLVMAVGGFVSLGERRGGVIVWAGLGILLGTVPYFLLAAVQL